MASTQETQANTIPGAGTVFALRAIGLVILVRWLYSLSHMSLADALSIMQSSPWAYVNLVFVFLLVFQPGARPRAERPFHPLPQWLRQALRLFAFFGFLFAAWSVGAFVWTAGLRRALAAVAETNGWLVAAPTLYAVVIWICRPRPLWRSNFAARRFALGRYAVALDAATRTVSVWAESRKLGQYDARELWLRWPGKPVVPRTVPLLMPPAGAHEEGGEPQRSTFEPRVSVAARSVPAKSGRGPRWAKVELLWDSPATAGHNRQRVFQTALASARDRAAVVALDRALRES